MLQRRGYPTSIGRHDLGKYKLDCWIQLHCAQILLQDFTKWCSILHGNAEYLYRGQILATCLSLLQESAATPVFRTFNLTNSNSLCMQLNFLTNRLRTWRISLAHESVIALCRPSGCPFAYLSVSLSTSLSLSLSLSVSIM